MYQPSRTPQKRPGSTWIASSSYTSAMPVYYSNNDQKYPILADDEQVKLLRHGVNNWNKWQLDYLKVHPDLHDTDLCGAYLNGTDFNYADNSQVYTYSY